MNPVSSNIIVTFGTSPFKCDNTIRDGLYNPTIVYDRATTNSLVFPQLNFGSFPFNHSNVA